MEPTSPQQAAKTNNDRSARAQKSFRCSPFACFGVTMGFAEVLMSHSRFLP